MNALYNKWAIPLFVNAEIEENFFYEGRRNQNSMYENEMSIQSGSHIKGQAGAKNLGAFTLKKERVLKKDEPIVQALTTSISLDKLIYGGNNQKQARKGKNATKKRNKKNTKRFKKWGKKKKKGGWGNNKKNGWKKTGGKSGKRGGKSSKSGGKSSKSNFIHTGWPTVSPTLTPTELVTFPTISPTIAPTLFPTLR